MDGGDLAQSIQQRCRSWFASNYGDKLDWSISLLFTELSLVAVHLNADSKSGPATSKKDFQLRAGIMTSIEETIKKHPFLERQLRSDLDRLWEIYR